MVDFSALKTAINGLRNWVDANMIAKINGKLNAPEQAAQPHQQLVTDADGVAQWEDKPFGVMGKEKNYVLEPTDVTMSYDFAAMADMLGVNKAGVDNSLIIDSINVVDMTDVYVCYDGEEYFFEGRPTCLVSAGSTSWYAVQTDKFMIAFRLTMHNVYIVSFDGNIGDVHNVSIYSYGDEIIKTVDPKYLPSEIPALILASSTEDSTKRFKITVDDSGTITATEVT